MRHRLSTGAARPRLALSRRFLLGLGTLVLLAAPSGCREARPAPPPNILLYVVDTLRADGLASYGNPAASTPSFDAFAREGVVFENAFANTSWTRSSMASLLTGLLPWHHGAEGRDDLLPEEVKTMAEYLALHGYTSALISSNPNVGSVFGFERAFDSLVELYARRAPGTVRGKELITPSSVVTREAIAWLESAPRPFFLVVLSIDPHAPYTPPLHLDPGRMRDRSSVDGLFPSLNRDDLGPHDQARIRELYQAEISFNDESFGLLLEAMRRRDCLRDTIAVLTSDHGEEFWEYGRRGHGKSLSEEVLRVPLVVRFPGSQRIRAGERVMRPVALVDVLPSILDLAGLPSPPGLDGRSVFAATTASVTPLLSSLLFDEHDLLAARQHPWKLVWDRSRDERALYDLTTPGPEARAVTLEANEAAAEAERRLRLALEASLAAEAGRPVRSQVKELPGDVEESLRALGYAE